MGGEQMGMFGGGAGEEPRVIVVKFEKRCVRCGKQVLKGVRAWWYRHNGVMVHLECMKKGYVKRD